MAAAKDDLKIEKGATYTKTWIYQDSAGVAIQLSAYEARMQIRERKESSAFIVELTSDPAAGITIEPAAEAGRIDIRIGADATDLLTFNTGLYDLELYDPLDVTEVIRLVEGSVIMKTGVTR